MDQRVEKNSFEKIYDVIRQIPRGQVASYGQIAALAGNRRWARVVGYALHAVPCNSDLPCHRVVTKDGLNFQEKVGISKNISGRRRCSDPSGWKTGAAGK